MPFKCIEPNFLVCWVFFQSPYVVGFLKVLRALFILLVTINIQF